MTFAELQCRMDKGVPVGVHTDGKVRINPEPNMVLQIGDRILVFSEERDSAMLIGGTDPVEDVQISALKNEASPAGCVVIIGYSDTLDTVLQELPTNVHKVLLAGVESHQMEDAIEAASQREELSVEFFNKKLKKKGALEELALLADHIVVLSDHDIDEEEADLKSIFIIMNLREIRMEKQLQYNITVEMRREHNQNLVVSDDNTDFVVSSSMSALFLAQLAESPELSTAFKELLSNDGNELYLIRAKDYKCTGKRTVMELRKHLMAHRLILIGYIDESDNSVFNPGLFDVLILTDKDRLIVIGEDL